LPESQQNRHDPSPHESLVMFALTRPVWDVEVHCIECLDYNGCGTFGWFMKALNYCRDYIGPDLVQASLGFSHLTESQRSEMQYASKHLLGLNAVLSAAGGNEGINPSTGLIQDDSVCYPAKLPQWVATGSAENGQRHFFSSVGEEIQFVMDGKDLKGVGLDGNVVEWSGTSGASPQYAGVCVRMIKEVDKLPVTIHNRQEWLLGTLPFLCWNPYEEINKYDILKHTPQRGSGSLQKVYNKFCSDFDRYSEDNL